jgi:HlyD family secretion protein
MSKWQTLIPAVLGAGAGIGFLLAPGCGGKPAPAAEAAVTPGLAGAQAMRVTQIGLRDIADEVIATGRLVVREEASVASELPGYRVSAVYVDEGDWVKVGEAMAKLDDALLQAQIAQAEATLATQKASLEFKRNQLQRAEALQQEGAFSQELLEQRRMETAAAEASHGASQAVLNEMKVRQSRMVLRAPVTGAVLQRTLRPGDISGASPTPYFRIARDGLIELDAELADASLAHIKVGDRAMVTLTSGKTVQGRIRFISPRVDQNTNLGRARVALPFDASLRPGSFAQARFSAAAAGVRAVPASAIRYEAGGASVMLVDEANTVRQTPVRLGQRAGGFVELVDGPPVGSRVLSTGAAFVLDGDVIVPLGDSKGEGASGPGER